MKTTMRAGKGTEVLAGWCIGYRDGRREFLRGISDDGAMRTADSRDNVEWVRWFAIENDVWVILA